jgi:anthranilate synthase component 1
LIRTETLDLNADFLALSERFPQRYPFLLESVDHGGEQSRYDILFLASKQRLVLGQDDVLTRNDRSLDGIDFFSALDDEWRAERRDANASTLPFQGGWFIFLSYEMAALAEPSLKLPEAGIQFPKAFAVRCHAALIRDHRSGEVMAMAEEGHEKLLDVIRGDLASLEPWVVPSDLGHGTVEEEPAERFERALETIHQYIIEGDVFQVNISRKWRVPSSASHSAVYAALRRHNPSPFAAIARWQGGAVVSSSPERLLESRDGWLQTRPIAGTRPRDPLLDDDSKNRQELIGHPKERAEHIMLIDLERNDLGRVCKPGTVEVDELMVVESYAHVHHIVSNVRGLLKDNVTPGQVIKAVFPGGTITGCPKVRCMEIIAELETEGRGPYTGSMGYLNRDGSMDFNILIRTLLCEQDAIVFRAGAGIVADSVSQSELEETRSKAKGMLLALDSEPDS